MIVYIATVFFLVAFAVKVLKPLTSKIVEFSAAVRVSRDVGCEKPHWLFGHIKSYFANEKGVLRSIEATKKFPKCTLMWLGPLRINITSYHPDFARTLLFRNMPKNDFLYQFIGRWLGDGLLTSSGDKWKQNRKLLTPVFHFEALKNYLVCMNEAVVGMFDSWSSHDSNKTRSIDVFEEVNGMALDNLLRCFFSKNINFDIEKKKEYLNAVKSLTEELVIRAKNPLYHFDFVYYRSAAGKRFKTSLTIAQSFTESAIRKRVDLMKNKDKEKYQPSKYDFLDVLLSARNRDGESYTIKEIRDELDTIVFRGHDTVTSGISWAYYHLAVHPDLQEKCRKEIKSVLNGGRHIDWNDLHQFEYLTRFIKESMRVIPPVYLIGRKMPEPTLFPRGFGSDQFNITSHGDPPKDSSRILPKNFMMSFNILMLHRNPAIWENQEEFDPDRFTPENISKRSPYAYLPFSAGPRNCIGQNFAMNFMKVTLALTLSRYRISIDPTYPKPEMQPHVVMRSKAGIHLMITDISDTV